MHHQILYLGDCARLRSRPKYIPAPKRVRGTKALGLGYEKKVGKTLRQLFGDVHSAVWFSFFDCGVAKCCQIDHFVVLSNQVLLVECKLSEKEVAWSQMRDLYAPILFKIYGQPVTRVQATKFIRSAKPINDIREALRQPGGEFLWHHLA